MRAKKIIYYSVFCTNEYAQLSPSLARSSNKVCVTCVFLVFLPLVEES